MSTSLGGLVVLSAVVAFAGPETKPDRVADAVTLRDGTEVLGEVVDAAGRGSPGLIVRREWVRQHAPDWAKRWEAAETPVVRRAADQRRERLRAWRRDRAAAPLPAGAEDRITPWIDRELARLDAGREQVADTPLMLVRLNRADVRGVRRAPAGKTRLLRLAWRSGFRDPEVMPVRELTEALEGRGFDAAGNSPVAVDALLPPQSETDHVWLLRRAATEVTSDPNLRFIRYSGLVLPEPARGQPLNLGGGLLAVSALQDLLGEKQGDPLAGRLQAVAARGRVGALVTQLEIAPDFSGVRVEITLWVRSAAGRWGSSGSRSFRVRPADLGPDAGKALAADPQVAMAFQLIESIGLGNVPDDLKRRSLNVGAATQKALGLARSAATSDLAALALPVLEPPRDGAAGGGRP